MRTREIRGQQSWEVVYAVTSLAKEEAGARELLSLSRAHWGIENRLFYVRDMTLREDQCRARKGVVPQIFAALRSLATTVFRRLGFSNIAAAIELCQEHRLRTIKLLHRRIK